MVGAVASSKHISSRHKTTDNMMAFHFKLAIHQHLPNNALPQKYARKDDVGQCRTCACPQKTQSETSLPPPLQLLSTAGKHEASGKHMELWSRATTPFGDETQPRPRRSTPYRRGNRGARSIGRIHLGGGPGESPTRGPPASPPASPPQRRSPASPRQGGAPASPRQRRRRCPPGGRGRCGRRLRWSRGGERGCD